MLPVNIVMACHEYNSPYCDILLTFLVMSREPLPVLDVNPDNRRKDASNKSKETNILIGSPRFFCVACSYQYMLTINSSTLILKHHVICRFQNNVFFYKCFAMALLNPVFKQCYTISRDTTQTVS